MPLSDFVNTQISSTGPAVTEENFGVPMILAADCPGGFTERVRTYNKPADMITDGFSTSSGAYKQASRLCQQTPRPPAFKIGRLALPPTQSWTITVTALNLTTYTITVDGVVGTYTSDSSATQAEIVTGLKASLGSISGLSFGGTTTLTITATVAGAFHTVSVPVADTATKLKVTQDHADPGAATDLDAILLEDGDWYALLNQFNSKLMATAIAGWAETNKKLFLCSSQDSDIMNVADGSASDLGNSLKASSDFYTAVQYGPGTDDFLDAGLDGLKLTTKPGSEVWTLTTVAGVPAQKFTATQRANMVAKRVGFMEANVAGLNINVGGKVASGEWIDVVRGKDWQANHIDSLVFEALHAASQTNAKVPFTDPGIALLQGVIQGALKDGVDNQLLAASPAPAVQVPLAANVSPTDKQNRTVTTITFTATLAGAIVAVNPITGTLTV